MVCRTCVRTFELSAFEEHEALHGEHFMVTCNRQIGSENEVCSTRNDFYSIFCSNAMCKGRLRTEENMRGEAYHLNHVVSDVGNLTGWVLAEGSYPNYECVLLDFHDENRTVRVKYIQEYTDDKYDRILSIDKIFPTAEKLANSYAPRKRNQPTTYTEEAAAAAAPAAGGYKKPKKRAPGSQAAAAAASSIGRKRASSNGAICDDSTSSMSGTTTTSDRGDSSPDSREDKDRVKKLRREKQLQEREKNAEAKKSEKTAKSARASSAAEGKVSINDLRQERMPYRVDYFKGERTYLDSDKSGSPTLAKLVKPPPPASVKNSGKKMSKFIDQSIQIALFHELFWWLLPAQTKGEQEEHGLGEHVVPLTQEGITFAQAHELLKHCPTTICELELMPDCKRLLLQPPSTHPKARTVVTATVVGEELHNADGEKYYLPRLEGGFVVPPIDDAGVQPTSLGHQIVMLVRRFLQGRCRLPSDVEPGTESFETEEEQKAEEEFRLATAQWPAFDFTMRPDWELEHARLVVARAQRQGACIPFSNETYSALLFLTCSRINNDGREGIENLPDIRGKKQGKASEGTNGLDFMYGGMYEHFVDQLVQRSRITQHQTFYDVGCGIGQVAIQVAATTGARCVGTEIDKPRNDMGLQIIQTFDSVLDEFQFRGARVKQLVNLIEINMQGVESVLGHDDGTPSLMENTSVFFFNNFGPYFVTAKMDFCAWISHIAGSRGKLLLQAFSLKHLDLQIVSLQTIFDGVTGAASWNRLGSHGTILPIHHNTFLNSSTCQACTLARPYSELTEDWGCICGAVPRNKRTIASIA